MSRLSPNDLSFVMLFVRTKGNLKEMERELGVSYWTIRRKLDEVVELLGQGGAGSGGAPREDIDLSQARLAVVGRLRRIDITAEDAEALRKEIKARVGAAKEGPDADSAPNRFAIWQVEPADAPKETTGDA